MLRRPPRSTRTDTLFPYTTLFRSNVVTAEDLASRRLGSGLDLNGLVPGFQLYNAIGGAASPTIRGLGSNTAVFRSEEHTSELQSLMRISYAVFCLKKKN